MQSPVPLPPNAPKGRLRIIETTDLHMQLLDYDYFSDRPDTGIGLIGLADQITALRQDPDMATLLCDNGDLIQGNPLADYLAAHLGDDDTHPMIAALNMLRYDALTLGNHDFDYGVGFLEKTLSKAAFPTVSANVARRDGAALAMPFIILERTITCDDGVERSIKIGVTGFGPPQISHGKDDGDIRVTDIVDAARTVVPRMQSAGADIIIALCHSGIGAPDHLPCMENAALPLAKVEGIDALLLGHTHDAFPDPTVPNTPQADFATGQLYGKPAVMGTYSGKSLGVIDLDMIWDRHKWAICGHKSYLHFAGGVEVEESPLKQRLRALVADQHEAVLEKMRAPIAHTRIPIVSYFATIQPDLSQQLLARAMQATLKTALSDTAYETIPLLAVMSSFRFGGRSGLGYYIDIEPGPITLHDAAAIFPFSDTLCAVRRTGKQLKTWLERSAAHYNQVLPGAVDTPLINSQSAGYNCDTLFGLSYEINLTQPSRFNTHGVEIYADSQRLQNIRYEGHPIADNDVFIVATNSFRAKGGGGFPAIAQEDVVFDTTTRLNTHLIDYLRSIGTVTEPMQPSWSFAPIHNATATFVSAAQARRHLQGPLELLGHEPHRSETYRIHF